MLPFAKKNFSCSQDEQNFTLDFNIDLLNLKSTIKKFLKLKKKRKLITADIKFINLCLKNNVTPVFVRKIVKFKNNSRQQRALDKKVLQQEIGKHYWKLHNLDRQIYVLHLEISKILGPNLFDNLCENFDVILNKLFSKKKENLKEKLDNLIKKKKKNINFKTSNEICNNVVNRSKATFSDSELNFLNLGLKTCPLYSTNVVDYVVDIERIIHNLDSTNQSLVRKNCENVLASLKKKNHFNKEKEIIQSLNMKGVFYTKADKGNTIVVLEKSDYILGMEDLLATDEYINIKCDPLKECVNEFNKTLEEIKLILNEKEKSMLKVSNPVTSRIYGLPKIHKPGNKFRPIVNNINSPTYFLAKHLVKKFSNITKFNSHSIKNSFELVESIQNLELSGNDFLVSFDVTSLFTNIPREKTLLYLEQWLINSNMKKEEISEYIILTKLIIGQNYFSFNKKFYKQKIGLAMGNPLSPFLADIYMSYFETHITEAFPLIFKVWYRYVDDIFAIVNRNLIEDALKLLNLQEKTIKFTCEVEKNNCLPFLDLLIFRNNNHLEFGIHTKSSNSDVYINNNSYNPEAQKLANFNHLTHRLVNLPLKKDEYQKEYNRIKVIAHKNGFHTDMVEKRIRKYKKQKEIKQTTTLLPSTEIKNFRKFTYHPLLHYKFQNIFRKFNFTLVPVNKLSVKNLIKFDGKDKIPNLQKSGIYKIPCQNCNLCYIGQTKRNLLVRYKEHLGNIKFKRIEKSPLAEHFWNESHDFDEPILLKQINSKNQFEFLIWENIYIHKNHKNLLNWDTSNLTPLLRFISEDKEVNTNSRAADDCYKC